jgi:hypothetical protein
VDLHVGDVIFYPHRDPLAGLVRLYEGPVWFISYG